MFSLQFLIVGDNEPLLSNNAGGATNDPKLDDNGIILKFRRHLFIPAYYTVKSKKPNDDPSNHQERKDDREREFP